MSTQDEIAARLRAAYTRTGGNAVGDPFVSAIAREIAAVADRLDLAGQVSAQLAQAERVANAMVEGGEPGLPKGWLRQELDSITPEDEGLLRAMGFGQWGNTPAREWRDDIKCVCVGRFGPNPDCTACDGDGTVGGYVKPASARDAGKVVEAARAVVADADDGVLKSVAGWYPTIEALRAAVTAYDSAPAARSVGSLSDDLTAAASVFSDAQAVRDAALEEAAEAVYAALYPKSEPRYWSDVESGAAGATKRAKEVIRALRSSPSPERVTDEEELAQVMDPRAVKAALPYARRVLAAYDLIRKKD